MAVNYLFMKLGSITVDLVAKAYLGLNRPWPACSSGREQELGNIIPRCYF